MNHLFRWVLRVKKDENNTSIYVCTKSVYVCDDTMSLVLIMTGFKNVVR